MVVLKDPKDGESDANSKEFTYDSVYGIDSTQR
jgi:hypothetical protein